MWGKIIAYAARYGTKAVKWCWQHKVYLTLMGWAAFDKIKELFG